MRNFFKLFNALELKNKHLCIGLDPDPDKFPDVVKECGNVPKAILYFNKAIVDKTKDLVCAYKPNFAFYEKHGEYGIEVLGKTIVYINQVAPNVPVILDYKRGDIGNTNAGSVALAKRLGADAITIAPYMGKVANQPFLDEKDMGIFVLVRTSNEGSDEFQGLKLENGNYLYQQVIKNVLTTWNENENCAVVIGATAPIELADARTTYPKATILIPGTGEQGGSLEKALDAGFNSNGGGIILNQSRSILYASKGIDFADAARAEAEKVNEKILAFKEKKFSKTAV